MRKYEFLYRLDSALESFSKSEREEIIHYYEELIQDAIDNGENEIAFIEKLGSIDKIVRTIKKDDDFVDNVKEKKNFELKQTFDKGVKVLGQLLYIVAIIFIVGFGISITVVGVNGVVAGLINLIATLDARLTVPANLYYIGYTLLHVGLALFGIAFIISLTQGAKTKLELLYEKLTELFNKGGK